MKLVYTIALSSLIALGSATAQAETPSAPLLLNNAQLDTVDAGSKWRPKHKRNTWGSSTASAGGTVKIKGAVYASGGADSSAQGHGGTAAGAEGGAAAIGARYAGRKGFSGGAAMAGGSSFSCTGAGCKL